MEPDIELSKKEKHFEKYLDELTAGLFNAKYQSRLYWKINGSIQEYEREVNQSRAFWGVILKSLQESSVLSLARVYDDNSRSITLKKFLDFIGKNRFIFKKENFKKRLQDNEYRDSLAATNRVPPEEGLTKDKELVSKEDATVNKLIGFRDKVVAHRDEQMILGHSESTNLLTWSEFDELVARGFEIRNRYSVLYGASTYSEDSLVGKDDYQSIFQYLRVADLTLNFVNMKSSSTTPENCVKNTEDFIGEVRKEIYKRYDQERK